MPTNRHSYHNCDALLSHIAPNRSLVDQDVFYKRAEEAGIINLGKQARGRLSDTRFLLPSYKTIQGITQRTLNAQAVNDRLSLLARTLSLPALSERDNNLLWSSLATSLDWNIGAAAKVAAPINQVRNFMASLLEQQARTTAHRSTSELLSTLREVSVTNNLNWSQADISEIATRLIEIGSLDRRMVELSPSAVVLADSSAKVKVLYNYLDSQFNINGQLLDDLLQLGTNVTYAFDDARKIARASGVPIETLTGLGWLHRQYTQPMLKYLEQFTPEVLFNKAVDAAHITLNTLLQASRRTNLFLVQDKVALATILGLTPADHIFVPQTTKVFDIPWKRLANNVVEVYKTSTEGFSNWVHANPHINVETTNFTSWKELKTAVAGQLPFNQALLDVYTQADYITYTKNGSVYVVRTPKAPTGYNLQHAYQWGAGRANDLSSFYYANPNYQTQVVRSSKPTIDVLGSELRKNLVGNKPELAKVKAALQARDESTIYAMAKQHLPYDGLVVQDTKTGGYLAFNLSTHPDYFINTALPSVDALFDPSFAYGLLDLLRDYTGGVTNSILDTLVDTGVLAKVPMSSDEFFEYFVQKYQLPFNRPSDVINMNFDELWYDAAHKMKQAVGASMVLSKILSDEGYQAGWVIPNNVYRSNTNRYSSYIRIGDDNTLLSNLENIGMGHRIQDIKNSYIHPMVARHLNATIVIGSSPILMGKVGSVLSNILRTFKKTVLLTAGLPKYVLNQTLDPLINSVANGGDITEIPVRLRDMILFLHNRNLDHLDDTVPRYLHPDFNEVGTAGHNERLTQRQATQLFIDNHFHGFGSGMFDVALGNANPLAILSDVNSLAWHMLKWVGYNASLDTPFRTISHLQQALTTIGSEAVNKAFAAQAFLATVSDKSIQLNHFLNMLRPAQNEAGVAAKRFATSAGFFTGFAENSTHLWEMMDTTFPNPFNAGKVTRALDNLGLPMFAVYSIKTPFNVMKMAARKPLQFYNFNRMWNIMSTANEVRTNQQDIEFTDYQQHSHVLGEYKAPNGHTERILLYDTFNNLFNTLDSFTDLNAEIRNDLTIHRIEDVAGLGHTLVQKLANDFINSSNPLLKAAYRVATDINPMTGDTYNNESLGRKYSFLFWEVDPATRDTLYEFIPFARAIDNWNPGEVFGTAPIKDDLGNVINDGKLGWNNVERYPLRNADRIKLSNPSGYNFMYRALTWLGFSVAITDADLNVQQNLRKLDNTVSKLESQYSKFSQDVTTYQGVYNPDERARRMQQAEEMASLLLVFKLEQLKWQYYMNEYRGKLTPAQINDANSKLYEALQKNGKHPLISQYHNLMQAETERFLKFKDVLQYGQKTQ